MVAAAIMSIQLVVRQTRAEEESGRAELVRAAVVGRRAPLTAALCQAAIAEAAIVVVITAGLAGAGLDTVDAMAMALGIGLTGLLFAAVAAVTAQLLEHGRAASGWAMAVLALCALVRGLGDIARPHGSALSWFSPIAWAQQTRAFVDLRWWPLLLSVTVVVVLVMLAYRLVAARDVGAGLVAPRSGPTGAARSLAGVTGLTVRLQRASLLGWGIALLLTGAVFGSLADDVTTMVAGDPELAAAVGAGAGDLQKGFFVVAAQLLGVAVAAFAVGSVLRTRAEEGAGRTEVVLATAVDRRRYLGGVLAVTAATSVGLLALAGLGTGLAAAAVTDDGGLVAAEVATQLARLPAVLVCAGVAGTLVGLGPRLASLSWLLVTWAVFVAFLGPLLRLPVWAGRLSPFGWLPRMPAEPVDWAVLLALTAVGAVLSAAGLVGFRRRDVPA